MSNWGKVRLGNVCAKVYSGGTPNSTESSYYNGNIPWLNTKEIDFNRIYNTEKQITQSGFDNSSAKWVDANSVIIAMYGATAGKVAINKIALTTNQACCNLVIDKNIADYRFIYYSVYSNYTHIASLANGGAQQNLNSGLIKDFEIGLPPLAEQRRIAGILGSLDDKIELNNRINKNLEEQASALFKRWFVDFEFPDTDGNPYKSSGGKIIGTPLGQIPDGWRVGTLRELIISILAGDWGKETLQNNFTAKVLCIRGADIPEVSKGNLGKMPTRYILEKNYISKKLSANNIVVEISGGSPTQSTGRIALISQELIDRFDVDLVCTNFCKAIQPIEHYSQYVYFIWKYLYDSNILFSYENGTTGIKNLDINGLLDTEQIIIPTKESVIHFSEIINRLYRLLYKNANQNSILAELRNTLIPKLMNNEIKI